MACSFPQPRRGSVLAALQLHLHRVLGAAGRRGPIRRAHHCCRYDGINHVHRERTGPMKTVVMTGGTSGIGQVAAQQILGTPNTSLLLGVRGGTRTRIETLPLDLTSLANVRAFAQA